MGDRAYYKCDICREAYFVTKGALDRHTKICIAVKQLWSALPTEDQPLRRRSTTEVLPKPPDLPLDLRRLKRSRDPEYTPAKKIRPSTSRQPDAPPLQSDAPPSEDTPAMNTYHAPPITWRLKKGLSSARDYHIQNPDSYYKDLPQFLEALLPTVKEILQTELQDSNTMKINMVLLALYNHPDGELQEFNFKTSSKTLNSGDLHSADEFLKKEFGKMLMEESEQQGKNSGWSLQEPVSLILKISKFRYNKPSGSSYITLPKKLEKKNALVNVQNRDQACFKYSMLVKHHPNPSLIMPEAAFNDINSPYNFDGLTFPLDIRDIPKFEKLNPGCSVNVFECGLDCEISPLRVVENELQDHTDLLLFKNGKGDSHYIYIQDFSQLIQPQLTKGRHKIIVCKRCSTFMQRRRCNPNTWLEEHLKMCVHNKPVNVKLPKEGNNLLKFKEFETQIPLPIYIVADFEAYLKPLDGRQYQHHEPNSFCLLVKSTLSNDILQTVGISTSPYLYRAEDAGTHFLLYLKKLAQQVEILYTRNEPLKPLTDEEMEKHENATKCDLCEQSFNDTSAIKVLDHSHISGEYRHTLCQICNLRCLQPNYIPIYFHNFSRYDQFFVLNSLTALKGCEIKVIPSGGEKFTSVSVKVGRIWLRFLDSYRMLESSLSELASNLKASQLIEASKLVHADYIDLITRKGVYPYDYVTSESVFDETSLPDKDKFYNQLNDEDIDNSDYEHAKRVWSVLNMKTFGEYHDFYLMVDVCLLADVLESFRKRCFEAYKIDCCQHFTAPGLAFRAMLRMTRVTLELITDADQMLFIESAVRGGLVQNCIRHVKANNPRLENAQEDYDPNKPLCFLSYLDVTNLYGYAMSLSLPVGDFKWANNISDWSTLPKDAPYGYFIEADIEVPIEVHDRLKDLPPLAEVACPPNSKTKKLLATLNHKVKYVAHYTTLQQAVSLGLKVTKIYRALKFTQSPWMARFVTFNSELRAKSTDAFSKAFFKKMSNAVYGKTFENVRNRVDIRIVTTDNELQKLYRQPRFKEHTIIHESVVAVHMRRKSVYMNKPLYIGVAVLDISKTYMYSFYYDVLKKHADVSLAYLDTDGIIAKIEGNKDLYDIFGKPEIAKYLDRSVFPDDHHPLDDKAHDGRIGLFKDECKRRPMFEFVGLRPKLYAYRFSSKEDDAKAVKLKAKGVKTSYVQTKLKFNDYKETLFTGNEPEKARFNIICGKRFQLYSTTVVKKSLSRDDDKRSILQCGIQTLPYGHYSLAVEDSNNVSQDGNETI